MKSVRAEAAAVAGNCNVRRIIPSPTGCLAMTATSPGPVTVCVMLASSPLCEKRQTSAVATPLCGRVSVTGLPPSVQELLITENMPRAATSKSTSLPGMETPAVVGSTTTMSLPDTSGAPALNEIRSSEALGVATTIETAFDSVPPGFCTCTLTLPASATSAAVTGAIHSCAVVHVVVRALPPINSTAPVPAVDAAKPVPITFSVNPLAAPA